MTAPKLDIFRVLGAVDGKQAGFYKKLDEDEQKAFQPVLLNRWMTGTDDAAQIYLTNEFLNPYVFSLSGHKQLLWQLATVCSSGDKKRYSWIKPPRKRESGSPTTVRLLKEYYGYNTRHAIGALGLLTKEQTLEIAAQLGWTSEDVSKLKKEL